MVDPTDRGVAGSGAGAWPPALRSLGSRPRIDLDAVLDDPDVLGVVLDVAGRIVSTNRQWRAAAVAAGVDPARVGVGADYLAACDAGAVAGGPTARSAAAAGEGIRSVLRGDRRQFTMDYECSGPDDQRWFTLRVAHLAGPGSGALVTHVEITRFRAAELAVRGTVDALWGIVDPEADFVFLLDEAGAVVARTRDETRPEQWPVIGQTALEVLHPADREHVARELAAMTEVEGGRMTVSFRAAGADDDSWRHFTATAVNMLDDPTVGGIVVAVVDVTSQLRAGASSALAAAVAEELPVTAIASDEAGVVIGMNEGAATLLGVAPGEPLGRHLRDYVAPLSLERTTELVRALDEGRGWQGELDIRRSDGAEVPTLVSIRQLIDLASGFRTFLYLAVDYSEERDLRASLSESEHRDSLTGLPNRPGFLRIVEQLLPQLGPGSTAAVAKVSLDRFREINDVHGSDTGDAVLGCVGAALVECAGAGAVVARVYGDVFAVAVPDGAVTPALGDRLREAVAVVEPQPGLAIRLSASVGIRTVTAADGAVAPIMDDALSATTEARKAGGGCARWFDEALRAELHEQAALRAELATAVARGQLRVEYQPMVRLADGVVVAVEALVRWQHPTRGLLAPDTFIPLAERSGVVHAIGAFVLDEACADAARWRLLRPEVPLMRGGEPLGRTARRGRPRRAGAPRARAPPPRPVGADLRAHRVDAHGGGGTGARAGRRRCGPSACASPWTTSAPGTARWPGCASCPSTR
jgi:diguanylate cyclase (GGDEF)-like protein/PAS domain S-box-containing protein